MSLLGGIFNLFGQARAERKAKRARDEENKFNLAMILDQREWDRQQVLEARAYDDPAAQRARLEAAGFNPAAFLTGPGGSGAVATSGVATSATSSVSPTAFGTAFGDLGMMLGQAFSNPNTLARTATMNKIAADNVRLRKELTRSVVNPRVAGIFESRPGTGGLRGPAGGPSDAVYSARSSDSPSSAGGSVSGAPADGPPSGGLWLGGEYYPMPPGYSLGEDVEKVLGEGLASEPALGILNFQFVKHNWPRLRDEYFFPRSEVRGYNNRQRRGAMGRAPQDVLLTQKGAQSVAGMGPVRSW